MGREVRKVPKDWIHPSNGKYHDGQIKYTPLFDGKDYQRRIDQWDEEAAKWKLGLRTDYKGGWVPIGKIESESYAEYAGDRPQLSDYMPQWAEGQATHFMMYETTSEGSPISPAFATPEELARWLADNKASAFGGQSANYESWLRVALGGYACSAIYTPETGMVSGVEGLTDK